MALTTDQIFAAADKIAASGIEPTIRRVREALGGGSFSTVGPALMEWRVSRQPQSPLTCEPTPAFLEQRLGQLANEFWTVARDTAEKRLAVEREGFEIARARLEAALKEAAELCDQLTLELEQAQAALAQSQTVEQALRADASEVRLQLSATQARCAELDRHSIQLQQECRVAQENQALARERAANLAGRLQAVEARNEALMTSQKSAKQHGERTPNEAEEGSGQTKAQLNGRQGQSSRDRFLELGCKDIPSGSES